MNVSRSLAPSPVWNGKTLAALRVLAILVAACVASGCAGMSDVVRAKAAGTGHRTYPVGKDDAWKIALAVFRWEGTDAIDEHNEGYVLTSTGAGVGTWGTLMGAWIEPTGPQETRVTVVTKRRLATNAITSLTETTFQARFQQGVSILRERPAAPRDAAAELRRPGRAHASGRCPDASPARMHPIRPPASPVPRSRTSPIRPPGIARPPRACTQYARRASRVPRARGPSPRARRRAPPPRARVPLARGLARVARETSTWSLTRSWTATAT